MNEPARIVENILIDEAALRSAERFAVFAALQNLADRAIAEALLMPGEFPPAALVLANLDYYAGQIENGGIALARPPHRARSGAPDAYRESGGG